ncbi:nucleotide-diphospho-sugar transferase [Aspergillus alliaceus]|uniref:Nucleotide-diphospho-sugar transferase n=1 Tax=Petromyces alliaceus TaxID=209559 RepID=A0A5N7C5T2_PETAA|nr:nucleotide-diphospho-sugar transferase [Aspergillus alliaceus]
MSHEAPDQREPQMAFDDRDIYELPPEIPPQWFSNQIFVDHVHPAIAKAALWCHYIYCTVRFISILTSSEWTGWMWLMLFAEWAVGVQANACLSMTAKASTRRIQPRLRLRGEENLPRVDVLVPCCGEPIEVILDTVRAACTMDYPSSRYRVLVLDDGDSGALCRAIAQLRSQWAPHLQYHTRGKKPAQRGFGKAANLNHALFTVQETISPPEFFTILDADCIPSTDLLRATLPHLLRDPQAAVATTRQYYYNLPMGDPLHQAADYLQSVFFPLHALCGGSVASTTGSLYRRLSISQLGGFPTISYDEDLVLSYLLPTYGYRSIVVPDILQFCRVPTSLAGHIAQRKRWYLGFAQQTMALQSSPDNMIPQSLRRRLFWQGMCFVASLVGRAVSFALLPCLLASGQQLVPTTSALIGLRVQSRLAIIYLVLIWLHEWLQFARSGFRAAPFSYLEDSWFTGAQLLYLFQFFLGGTLAQHALVTGSSKNPLNRSKARLSSPWNCIRYLWETSVLYNVILLLVTVAAMVYAISMSPIDENQGDDHNLVNSVTSLLSRWAWPPICHLWYLSVVNCCVPIVYLSVRPAYPDRITSFRRTSADVPSPSPEMYKSLLHRFRCPLGCGYHFLLVLVGLAVASLTVLAL